MGMDMRVYKNTADISLRTLIRECSNNKIASYDLFQMFRNTNRKNISTIFKYKTFNDDFTDTLRDVEIHVNLPASDSSDNFRI